MTSKLPFNGMKVIQHRTIPDDEMWVSPQTFELLKRSIPEIKIKEYIHD